MTTNHTALRFFEKLDLVDSAVGKQPDSTYFDEVIAPLLEEELVGEYFFNNLSTIEWRDFVDKRGLLSVTPTTPRLVAGAKLRYLARAMTESDRTFEIVIEDDFWVMQTFLALLLALPPNQSAKYVQQLRGKHSSLRDWQNFALLGNLAQYFAKSKFDKESADIVFDILCSDDKDVGLFDLETFVSDRLIEIVMSSSAPLIYTDLMAQSLLPMLEKRSDQPPNDFSYIWRPAIEDHEQNIQTDRDDYIISALRDAATWCITNVGLAKEIFDQLSSYKWLVFRRVSIFLSSLNESPVEIWKGFLFDTKLIFDTNLWHEYSLLLKSKFVLLSEPERDDWVDFCRSNVPATLRPDQGGIPLRDRLTLVREMLSTEVAAELQKLEVEYGPARHPDFFRFSAPVTWVDTGEERQEDSLSEEEILSLAQSDKLISVMKDDRSVIELLSLRLPSWVASQSGTYLKFWHRNKDDVPSQIVESILSGINTLIRTDRKFDVPLAIAMCAQVTAGGLSKSIVANFLYDLLSQRTKMLVPSRDKAGLWALIEYLCVHAEDPQTDHESDPRANMSRSINSARGQALHAAMYYIYWLKSTGSLDDADRSAFLLLMENRLNIKKEASCSVRSVFGEWLPWLVELNSDWVRSHMKSLFPKDVYGDAVWFAYLSRNTIHKSSFDLLLPKYEESIGTIGKTSPPATVQKDLAEHIVLAHLSEIIKPIEGTIIEKFFSVVPGALQRQALEFLFNDCNRAKEPDAGYVKRVMDLWTFCSRTNDPDVISAVGKLFLVNRLDLEWRFAQLERVLDAGVLPEDSGRVLIELAKLSDDHLVHVLPIARSMANLQPEKFNLFRQEKELRRILSNGLASQDESLQKMAIELIHMLGSFGLMALRSLLTDN